jgi:ribosomal protein L11 methylase PrmA
LDSDLYRDPGSFRDPSGYVFVGKTHVLRTVNPAAAANFRAVIETGALNILAEKGHLLPSEPITIKTDMAAALTGPRGDMPEMAIRQPRLPMISYPFEWTFSQLKDAALSHLDLQIAAFDLGLVLSDATPYNMQFHNGRVVHIDTLSLRPYRPGEIWVGYNQFTRLFLLPLLLEAWRGVPFQPCLRGQMEGVSLTDARQLLPAAKRYLSLTGLMHVTLQERAGRGSGSSQQGINVNKANLPRARFRALLTEMRVAVSALKSARRTATFWSTYAGINTYSGDMQSVKTRFVQDLVRRHAIRSIWDVGGNTGDYAAAALAAGATNAVVLDGDLDSLEQAYQRRKQALPDLLPLYVDCADPTPNQGWNQSERSGLRERAQVDAVLALALVHHLAIGRNIPLKAVIDWFVDLAPNGIIEFVPKSDPMVRQMLQARDDVFLDYDEAHFRTYLSARAEITAEHRFAENGRVLMSWTRKT